MKKMPLVVVILCGGSDSSKESSAASEYDRLYVYLDNYTGIPGLLARS